MRVLNVGGGASRDLPEQFAGWEQALLDIDPAVNPDICLDARLLGKAEPCVFDAVYCSHNLEHYYQHDVSSVLQGFLHVLKPGGLALVSVPNVTHLMRDMLSRGLDINDTWYRAGGPNGQPVTYHDVLYGWSTAMRKGNLFFAHKCGFTGLSLREALEGAGFTGVEVRDEGPNLTARGTKCN